VTPDAVKRRVLEIYAEADREVAAAGPVCVASGRCCRFKEYGHTLFISNLEANVLLGAAPPYERPIDDTFCPFQKEKLCTAREPRPLGCRVYFCDPNYQGRMAEIMEKHLAQLKSLSVEAGIPWQYATLNYFLNHPEEAEFEVARCE
jgi:hypothetical protein